MNDDKSKGFAMMGAGAYYRFPMPGVSFQTLLHESNIAVDTLDAHACLLNSLARV